MWHDAPILSAVLVTLAATGGVTDSAAVESRARAVGLGRVAVQIARASRPSMRLDRTLEGARPTLGSSRLGGSPALSRGQRWPTCKGDPMAFLGQVRLADIPADVRGGLPGRGLLAFFVYVEEEEPGTGFWLEAGRCSSAIVTRAGSAVVRREAPKVNPRMVLRPARVALRREMTIPDVDANDQPTTPLGQLNLKRRESQAYRKLRLALMPQPRAGFGAHRLGGYADTIQEDPRTYCKGAPDTWRLLLQFEWDEDLGFEVADGGGVRIFARAGDLARGHLTRLCTTFDSN